MSTEKLSAFSRQLSAGLEIHYSFFDIPWFRRLKNSNNVDWIRIFGAESRQLIAESFPAPPGASHPWYT
jgi:hypothetical protein